LKRSFSISLRLTSWFSSIFLAGFLIFGAAMWGDLAWNLSKGRDKTLGNRARRLTELLESSQRDPAVWKSTKFDNFAEATPEGNFIQVFDETGKRVYPAEGAINFPWPKADQDGRDYLGYVRFESRHYRALSRTVKIGGQPMRLFIAGQLEDNRTALTRFTEGLLWTAPVVLLLSALAGYFVSRRALTPVDRLIASARSISIGNLSKRLPVSETADELARLAETCNEMLERLEKAVGQITRFTADASHELRSPLAFIRTVAECALGAPDLDRETAESFRDIVNETKHASCLLEDMLTLARADSGHADIIFETVDLAGLVRELAAKSHPLAQENEQRLTVQTDAPLVCVTGDPTRLRRLLWILTDNAIKYTPRGGLIELSVCETENGVILAVTDTGIGIPEAALPHIFERFFRVDAARSQQDGTGLGLAIAKWIADVHLASFSVESEEHAGSRFQVTFPLPSSNDGPGLVYEFPANTANL
jgi:heavy metal sensor kinase